MEGDRLFNLRLCAVIFASLVMGIAFSVNLVLGIVFAFVLLLITILIFLRPRKVGYIIVIMMAYLTGFLYASGLNWANDARIDYPDEGCIVGNVAIDSAHDASGVVDGRVVLDNVTYNDTRVDGRCVLYIGKGSGDTRLKIGDEVTLIGSMYSVPIDTSALGEVRPYIDGIRYDIRLSEIVSHSSGELGFRDRTVFKVENILFDYLDEDTAGFLSGMMFGDTSLTSCNVKSASRRLGIAHLFAVSGLHVGMIVGFVMMILDRTKLDKRWHLLILPFLYFYAYMCDFSVSVIRACIMVTLLLVSRAIYMRYDMLSSLCFAGDVILLLNPYYLFDLSFVMSFLAVLSIALFSDKMYKYMVRKSKKHWRAKIALAANISVNIGLLPIMLHVFGGVSLLTVPINFLLIPIIMAIFPLFFLLTVIVLILYTYVILQVIAFPFYLIVHGSIWIARLNFAGINFDVSALFVITYVIVMICVSEYVFIKDNMKRVPKIILLMLIAVSIVVPPITRAICGHRMVGTSTFSDYAVLYEDDEGRDVLVVMGEVDEYIFARASSLMSHNNLGNVDILVVPNIVEKDSYMVDEFAESIGARYVLTECDVVLGSAELIHAERCISINDGSVVVEMCGARVLLMEPRQKYYNGYYDVVIAHNMSDESQEYTSKYYTNFAQSSHAGVCTGFTFYANNGKITLYRELN